MPDAGAIADLHILANMQTYGIERGGAFFTHFCDRFVPHTKKCHERTNLWCTQRGYICTQKGYTPTFDVDGRKLAWYNRAGNCEGEKRCPP